MSTTRKLESARIGAAALFVLLSTLVITPMPVEAASRVNTLEKKLLGWKESGVAIRGYDPVAYFTEGAPREGLETHQSDWNGATWRFSSAEHKSLFDADPEKYAPQYGGYCAYGVAQGYLVKIEPEQWSIVDGKLYLNYDAGVQSQWLEQQADYIDKADRSFENLLDE